jgi:PAS domain S-box-containing protein
MSAPIVVGRQPAGRVEVGYLEEVPEGDEGPFPEEERLLLGAVAERVGRIAERKRAEDALGESEAQYRDLVENMNDVIYALDESGKMTYISPAVESLIGYSPAEVMGREYAEFIYPEDLGQVRQGFGAILAGRSLEAQEYRLVTRSGDFCWIRTSSRPVLLQDRIVGIQGVLADITESKQAEEALKGAMAAAERARRLEAARQQEAERRRQIAEVLGDVVTALNSD